MTIVDGQLLDDGVDEEGDEPYLECGGNYQPGSETCEFCPWEGICSGEVIVAGENPAP